MAQHVIDQNYVMLTVANLALAVIKSRGPVESDFVAIHLSQQVARYLAIVGRILDQ